MTKKQKMDPPDINWEAFVKDKERLLLELGEGTYVAYTNGNLVATGKDLKTILAVIDEKFPLQSCFVHQLFKVEPVIHIPGFTIVE